MECVYLFLVREYKGVGGVGLRGWFWAEHLDIFLIFGGGAWPRNLKVGPDFLKDIVKNRLDFDKKSCRSSKLWYLKIAWYWSWQNKRSNLKNATDIIKKSLWS